MNTLVLLLPALVNVIVTGIFAGVVVRQYASRRRLYQLYWSIGLCMAFVATLAYVLMVSVGPTSTAGMLLFRLYYMLGAAIMPAWLGLGSLALVTSPYVSRISLSILSFFSLIAVFFISDATINLNILSQIAGTPGTGTLRPGPWLVVTIVLNTLGVIAVVGVAIYSGWKMIRRQKNIGGLRTSNLLWANVLILIGDLLNATAGSLARFLSIQSTFWLIMALGWGIFFLGVLLASQRSRTSAPAQEVNQQQANVMKS